MVWLILAEGLILAEATVLSCLVMGKAFDPAWIPPGTWEQHSWAQLGSLMMAKCSGIVTEFLNGLG